jgi:hypothetical protein
MPPPSAFLDGDAEVAAGKLHIAVGVAPESVSRMVSRSGRPSSACTPSDIAMMQRP